MPAAWPATLPQQPSGYSEKDVPNVLRSENDSGPPKTRRRFTKAKTKAQIEFMLTLAQYNTLKGFYKTTLKDGALSMNFTHPWSGAVKEMFISEEPSYSADGPLGVRVTMAVEYF